MKQFKIILCLITFISASAFAVDIENFDEEFSICSKPSTISCDETERIRFGDIYDSLTIRFNTTSADEDSNTIDYKVEFDNNTDCDVTIGSTLLRHGDSIDNLDWGNIEINANSSKTSKRHTFYFSNRDSDKYDDLTFSLNGLASCPDE